MRGVDPRVTEVVATTPKGKSWASGYRVSADLVLTAKHVVAVGEKPSQGCSVRPLGTADFVPADPVWISPTADLALLRAPALPEIHPGSAPRWGRFEGHDSVPCRTTGFPVAHARTDASGRNVRDPEPVEGTLKVATSAKGDLVDISVLGSVPEAVAGDTLWAGISGSAVLCGPWLVAVVVSDPSSFGPDRLRATLVETALADPALRALLVDEGLAPDTEVADLPDALRSPQRVSRTTDPVGATGRSLVRLLQPEAEVVPFLGRDAELGDLANWCAQEDRISVRVLVGPGGQGKTRLARRFCQEQAAGGWVTGIVPPSASSSEIEHLFATSVPLLVVVDSAESRVDVVLELVSRAELGTAAPVRLLLLARAAGEWWDGLPYRTNDVAGDVLAAAEVSRVQPLTADIAQRRTHFRAAAQAFGERLGRSWEQIGVPDLSDASFGTLLVVHVAALIAVERGTGVPSAATGGELLRELLYREDAAQWDALAPPSLRGDLLRTTRRRAVAVATLTAAPTEDQARVALRALPDFATGDVTAVVYWLHALYPSDSYLGPLRPDLFGEALVAEVVRDRPDLPELLLTTPDVGWAARVLLVLTQASGVDDALLPVLDGVLSRCLAGLIATARASADAGLGHAVARALTRLDSPPAAAALESLLPPDSLSLAEAAVAAYAVRLAHAHDPGERAVVSANLAGWLGQTGRTQEALESVQSSVTDLRGLAGAQPYGTMLALALNNLAANLNSVGRTEEALAATQEALDILGGLAANEDWLGSWLTASPGEVAVRLHEWRAGVLGNRVDSLGELGREREAIDTSTELVALRRELADQDARFRPALADALEQFARLRARWGDEDDAAAKTRQALDEYRAAATADPDAHRPALARALTNAAGLYARWGRTEAALELADEAVELDRSLAALHPDRFQRWTAMALRTSGDCLTALGRNAEAMRRREELVEQAREITDSDPSYRPRLAAALVAQGSTLRHAGRPDDALRAVEEAVSVYRGPAGAGGASSDVADALEAETALLADLGRLDDALAAGEQAIVVRRQLVAARPQAGYRGLTETLTSQARLLLAAGREQDALAAFEEAVQLPDELASALPGAFWALGRALMEMADLLEGMGRLEEAEAARSRIEHLPMPVSMVIRLPPVEAGP